MAETFIRVDPSVNFGRAQIGGACVESVAGMVWAGEPLDVVAGGYDLTTAQVLVACWYQARYGTSTWCSRWGDWARAAEPRLWHGTHDQVDDPPAVNRG